ncbi:MAG: peptide deformylase [Burkholderiales bacterium]|nr:peptide deformylase [Burkholderiales bacterium]
MALLEILHYPDERLHQRAKPVTEFNDELRQFIENMKETMYESNGIGLAATQVNVQKRIFVTDLAKENEASMFTVYINPIISDKIGEIKGEEGCLSVPGVFETVTRAEKITLQYHDEKGNLHTITCDGLKAICIQHENDHLDGKVFVDYLSGLKQNFIKKKMKKLFKK